MNGFVVLLIFFSGILIGYYIRNLKVEQLEELLRIQKIASSHYYDMCQIQMRNNYQQRLDLVNTFLVRKHKNHDQN